MKRLIEIDSFPQDMGGVAIEYDGKPVASCLNTMEAFITLAGMLAGGPQLVKLTIKEVSGSFMHHYETGRKAVAQAAPRFSSNEKLELVEVGGRYTSVMCPLQHKEASIRILRRKGNGHPVKHWFQCPEGHGSNHWPSTIDEARQVVGMASRPSVNTLKNLIILGSE